MASHRSLTGEVDINNVALCEELYRDSLNTSIIQRELTREQREEKDKDGIFEYKMWITNENEAKRIEAIPDPTERDKEASEFVKSLLKIPTSFYGEDSFAYKMIYGLVSRMEEVKAQCFLDDQIIKPIREAQQEVLLAKEDKEQVESKARLTAAESKADSMMQNLFTNLSLYIQKAKMEPGDKQNKKIFLNYSRAKYAAFRADNKKIKIRLEQIDNYKNAISKLDKRSKLDTFVASLDLTPYNMAEKKLMYSLIVKQYMKVRATEKPSMFGFSETEKLDAADYSLYKATGESVRASVWRDMEKRVGQHEKEAIQKLKKLEKAASKSGNLLEKINSKFKDIFPGKDKSEEKKLVPGARR